MPTWDGGVGSPGGSFAVRLNASENVNAAGNYSTVSWSVQLVNYSYPNYLYFNNNSSSWSINIGGHTASGGATYNFNNGQVLTIASGTTGAIYHDSNGQITINASASFSGAGNYPLKSGSAGGGWTLTDFDRSPTTPSITSSARDITGASFQITGWSGGVNNGGPTVTWTLQRADNNTFSTNLVNVASTTTSGSTLKSESLATDKTYYYRIRATNTDGTKDSGTITSYGVPGPPSSFSVTPSTTDAGKVALSWVAPTNTQGGVTGYDVFVNDIFVQNTNATSLTLTKSTSGGAALTSGTPYNFRVASKNATNTSTNDINSLVTSRTNNISVKSPGPPTAPTFGSNPPTKTGRNVTINVSNNADGINASTPVLKYFVQYQSATTSGGTYTAWSTPQQMTASGSNFTHTYDLMDPALWYKFRVYATNSIINNSAGTRTYYPNDNLSYTANFSPSASGTTPLFVSSGGKRWNGSAWVPTETAKRYNGSTWVDITIAKRWDGSSWVDLT